MAFTTFDDRSITNAWGITQVVLTSTATIQGDLLTVAGALADKDAAVSKYVALDSYLDTASDRVGNVALGVAMERIDSSPTGGLSTEVLHSGALGARIWLGDDGKMAASKAGAYPQEVGWCNTTAKIVLQPTNLVSTLAATDQMMGGALYCADDATFAGGVSARAGYNVNGGKFQVDGPTGNTTVAGTLTQTGALTVAGVVNANGGLVMGAADSLRMTAQEYTTSGTLTPWGYAKINSTAAISLTLPAGSTSEHRFLVIGQVSTGTTSATVTCSGCNLSAGALTTGVSAVFNAQYEALILYNPVSTNWHVRANVGGITIS